MDFSSELRNLLENEGRYSDEFFTSLKKYFKSGNRPIMKNEILSLLKKNSEIYNLIYRREFTETQLKVLYVLLTIEKIGEEVRTVDIIRNYYTGTNPYEFSDIFLFFNEKISEIKNFSGFKIVTCENIELEIFIGDWIEETLDSLEYKLVELDSMDYKGQYELYIALNLLSNIIFRRDREYANSDYVNIGWYNKIVQSAYDQYVINNINESNFDIVSGHEELKEYKMFFPDLILKSSDFTSELLHWKEIVNSNMEYINSFYKYVYDIFLFRRADFIYNLILLLKNTKSKQSYINNLNFILTSLFPKSKFNNQLDILYKENFKEILIILNPSEFFMPFFSQEIVKILMRIFNFFYRTVVYEYKLRKDKNIEKFKVLNKIYQIKNKILGLYEFRKITSLDDIKAFNKTLQSIDIDIIRNANKTIDGLNKFN